MPLTVLIFELFFLPNLPNLKGQK